MHLTARTRHSVTEFAVGWHVQAPACGRAAPSAHLDDGIRAPRRVIEAPAHEAILHHWTPYLVVGYSCAPGLRPGPRHRPRPDAVHKRRNSNRPAPRVDSANPGGRCLRHGAARAGLTPKSPALPIGTQLRITRLRGSVRGHNSGDSRVRPARAAPWRPHGCIDWGERSFSPPPRLKKEKQPGGLNPGVQPWGAKRVVD